MANDFKLKLSAEIDTTQIQKQLDQLSKNTTVKVSSSGSTSPLKPMLDDANKIDKITQDQIKSQQKLNAEFAKYQQQVDVFLAKTQKRDLSLPGAQGALDVRNQMQGVLNGPVTPEAVSNLKELSNQGKIADANFQGLNSSVQTFNDKLVQTIKSSLQTALGIGLIYSAFNQLKEGIQYVVDLNKQLTDIQVLQVEGAQTSSQVNELATSYNNLAKELGTTTLAVTESAGSWLRQGKTIQETNDLIKSTTYLSTLGNLDMAKSTEDLTAILNGFKLEAKDATDVVSKLISIDNISATSAGSLADALQQTANSAQLAGVDLETLTAQIGTVEAVTQKSGDTIGQAFPERARGI